MPLARTGVGTLLIGSLAASPTRLALYGLIALFGGLAAAGIAWLFVDWASESENADTDSEPSEAETWRDAHPETDTDNSVEEKSADLDIDSPSVEDTAERQLSELAPPNFVENTDSPHLRTGKDTHIRSFFVSDWPDQIDDGQLREIFSRASLEFDVGMWVDPIASKEARQRLKDEIEELEADYQLALEDGSTVEAEDIKDELDGYRAMRNTIRDTSAELFDVAMEVSVAAPTKKQLRRRCEDVRDDLISNGFDIIAPNKEQKEAHKSVTPILDDKLGQQQAMMSAAIGGMFPWSSGTLINESGVPLGEHAENGSPIIYDRFSHDRGYNWMTIGNIGAGKSFSTKLHFLRRRMYDPDTILVMLDPLEGFAGLASALNSRQVMVGGDTGLNPLEIKRVPQEILDANPELDPGKAKLKDLKAFFKSFFELRDQQLGEKWDVLSRALRAAYEEVGIDLDDPTTHGREPPTIQDHVIPNLVEIVMYEQENSMLNKATNSDVDMDEVFKRAGDVTQREKERATELLLALESFLEGNALSNMGGQSDFEMGDESSLYIDLQQQEGRGSLGLMMNLLFSEVYERAKQTDKNIIFAIDEARYIMRDKSALEFLEQAVRHSRHYDLSIQFITQTVDEFFQHPESEAIANQCDHKLFFHTEGVDEDVAEKVDMNPVQADFVRNATPGDEDTGYSEACLHVSDKGWYPVHIRAMDEEATIVDLDPTVEIEDALPGMSDEEELPARVEEIREYLLDKHQKRTQAAKQSAQSSDESETHSEPIPTVNEGGEDADPDEATVDVEALNEGETSIEDVFSQYRSDHEQPMNGQDNVVNGDTPVEMSSDIDTAPIDDIGQDRDNGENTPAQNTDQSPSKNDSDLSESNGFIGTNTPNDETAEAGADGEPGGVSPDEANQPDDNTGEADGSPPSINAIDDIVDWSEIPEVDQKVADRLHNRGIQTVSDMTQVDGFGLRAIEEIDEEQIDALTNFAETQFEQLIAD